MIQEPFFIDENGRHLYGVLFLPEKDLSNKVFLFCHPLFEEKKASHRVLVELAGALARIGSTSLMLDLRACGDSGGSDLDFPVSEWLEDIHAGVDLIRTRFGNLQIGLLGIRFGATLACQFADGEKGIEELILIDPAIKGKDYLDELFQQKCIREMMTCGESRTDVPAIFAELEKGGQADVDGTIMASVFYESLKRIDLSAQSIPSIRRILLVQQSPRKNLLPAYEGIRRKFLGQNIEVDIAMLALPPFWKAVDMADSEKICSTIIPWCR